MDDDEEKRSQPHDNADTFERYMAALGDLWAAAEY